EALDPVVVLDAGLLRVDLAHPHDRAAAAEGEHDQVVRVGAVDAPLLVRGDPVQDDLGVAVALLALHVVDGAGVDRRPVAHQLLTEGLQPGVILEELLAAGDGAPRDVLVDVGVAGVVRHVLVFQARPGRAGDDLARLRLDVAEADRLVLLGQRQVAVVAAGELRQRGPGLHGDVAVGLRRQAEDDLGGIDGRLDLRPTQADALLAHDVVQLAEEIDFILGVPVDALAAVAELVEQRAEGAELLVGGRIVALDHGHVWAVLARLRIDASGFPVGAAERLRQFAGAVVQQRHGDQVLLHAQMTFGHLREGLGDALVDFPVGPRLPGRIDGRRQRVDEGMHVRGVHVVLLVPGGGRQDDVGIHAGGGHAEVQGGDQVELADGALVDPLGLARLEAVALAEVLVHHAVLRAQEVLEHVLVALAGAAQQVGAPDEHVAREVIRVVRLLAGELQRTVLERTGDVVYRRQAGGLSVTADLQRIAVELRRARQPAGALGADIVVEHVLGELRLVGQRREHLVDAHLLVAPLRAVVVEEAGAVHLPRRPAPVQAEGQRQPAALRTQLLLADVVGPAATGLADATAEHEHVDQPAVVHVHVIPVVHRRADDDHRAATGLVGVVGELAGDLDRLLARNAGDLLLPGRGARHAGVVVAVSDVGAAQATVDAEVGGHQVEHGGDLGGAAVGQRDRAHRHTAQLDGLALGVLEMLVQRAAEIGEGDFGGLAAVDLAQGQVDLAAVPAFAGLDVPLALLAPAVADRAQRGDQLAAGGVEGDGFPLGVVLLAEIAGQVRGAQE